MKVILIKDCKQGKVNDVIEVSPGYARNFLFKNNIAKPYTKANQFQLNKTLDHLEEINQETINKLKGYKNIIEKEPLTFTLNSNNDKVSGSISSKQIIKKLLEKNIVIKKHYFVKHVHVNEIGQHIIDLNMENKVKAKLIVIVKKAGNE